MADVIEIPQEVIDAKIKELGYDEHAKEALKRTRDEAKSHREKAEKLEEKYNKLTEAVKEAETKAEREKAEAALRKQQEEDARKPLEERVVQNQAAFERAMAKMREDFDKEKSEAQQRFESQLKERDKVSLRDAVLSAANKRGLIDEDLIDMFDYSDVTMDKGRVNKEKLDAFLDSAIEKKPFFFKQKEDEGETVRSEGQVTRPASTSRDKAVDAAELPKEKFKALEEKLRGRRT